MKQRKFARTLFLAFAALMTVSCTGIPDGVIPVTNFQLNKYLGTWHEIARLDHSFESGLNNVTATYSMRGDGGVRVINRGFNAEENRWNEAEGKAYFVEEPGTGYLKVSFFGPFYGSYIVFGLDDNYQYSMVSGPDKSYLWLLSRAPTVPDSVKQRFLNKAKSLGFDTDSLIFPETTLSL